MVEQRKRRSWLGELTSSKPQAGPPEHIDEVIFKPALRQLGTAPCPVCQRETAVFLTRTSRPFQNCGYCSARVFFNGRESMRLLKKKMKTIEPE